MFENFRILQNSFRFYATFSKIQTIVFDFWWNSANFLAPKFLRLLYIYEHNKNQVLYHIISWQNVFYSIYFDRETVTIIGNSNHWLIIAIFCRIFTYNVLKNICEKKNKHCGLERSNELLVSQLKICSVETNCKVFH